MPLVKRVFYIPCKGDLCLKLAEIINEKAPAVEHAEIKISDNGLYITLYGYKTDVRNAWEYIKRIASLYLSAIRDTGGIKRIKLEYLVDRLRRTFPPRLLAAILNYMGYRCEYDHDKNELVTDAPLEIIEDIAKKIAEIIDSIKYDVRGTTTKYYVVAASIILNTDLETVYRIGVEKKHLVLDEDGKYRIRIYWKQAIEELIREHRGI
ncbi:MAG: DUF2067 family protein [Thermoprotei archaeon]